MTTIGVRPDLPFDQITSGELAVLELIAQGYSNRAIARELCLAPKTVEGRASILFDKMRLPERDSWNRRVLAVITYRAMAGPGTGGWDHEDSDL